MCLGPLFTWQGSNGLPFEDSSVEGLLLLSHPRLQGLDLLWRCISELVLKLALHLVHILVQAGELVVIGLAAKTMAAIALQKLIPRVACILEPLLDFVQGEVLALGNLVLILPYTLLLLLRALVELDPLLGFGVRARPVLHLLAELLIAHLVMQCLLWIVGHAASSLGDTTTLRQNHHMARERG